MKWRYCIEVLGVAACAAMLTPVVSRASRPATIPPTIRIAASAQSSVNASGNAQYRFTTIDAPGSSDTEAWGINTTGVVAGFYLIQGHAHGFVWQDGSLTTADHSGALHTLLGDVNEPGLVIGNYGSFFLQHATIYSIRTGTFTTLPDVPNLPMNFGNGINPQGTAVGTAAMGNLAGSFNNVGWTWNGREYSFFNVPGTTGFGTFAGGINAPGQVAGYFQGANGSFHGFLKDGSTFTPIDVPGATDTFAYAINNRSDVAGWYLDQQGGEHGFVLSGGTFTTIDVPGSSATMVTGINDRGELAGLWFDSNGTHAFLASPH